MAAVLRPAEEKFSCHEAYTVQPCEYTVLARVPQDSGGSKRGCQSCVAIDFGVIVQSGGWSTALVSYNRCCGSLDSRCRTSKLGLSCVAPAQSIIHEARERHHRLPCTAETKLQSVYLSMPIHICSRSFKGPDCTRDSSRCMSEARERFVINTHIFS